MAALAVVVALVGLPWLLTPPPEQIPFARYKELRSQKASGSWILVGRVHSSGKTLGAGLPGAPQTEMVLDGTQLHFLRLEDDSGDRCVVWVNTRRTPIPAKDREVRVTGSFRRVPVRMGQTDLGESTIGVASEIQ